MIEPPLLFVSVVLSPVNFIDFSALSESFRICPLLVMLEFAAIIITGALPLTVVSR